MRADVSDCELFERKQRVRGLTKWLSQKLCCIAFQENNTQLDLYSDMFAFVEWHFYMRVGVGVRITSCFDTDKNLFSILFSIY